MHHKAFIPGLQGTTINARGLRQRLDADKLWLRLHGRGIKPSVALLVYLVLLPTCILPCKLEEFLSVLLKVMYKQVHHAAYHHDLDGVLYGRVLVLAPQNHYCTTAAWFT